MGKDPQGKLNLFCKSGVATGWIISIPLVKGDGWCEEKKKDV